MTWAMLLPRKEGTEFPWIAKRAARFIDQFGLNEITLRWGDRTSSPRGKPDPERPPVRESPSNGIRRTSWPEYRRPRWSIAYQNPARKDTLVEFAAYLMNRCDTGSDAKRHMGERQHTDAGTRGEDFAHARQAITRMKVGTAIPSWCVCWHAELVVRGSGCHRARAGWRSRRAQRKSGEFLSRRTPTKDSECELFRGLRIHSTFQSEWRAALRWCLVSRARF